MTDDTTSPSNSPNVPANRRTSLADALFTSTQQKVLGLLFGQPDRSFFVTRIMELARAGRGAVQRELKRLENAGLVIVEQKGNQKHYQANRASPLFDEIVSIVRKTVAMNEPISKAITSMPGTVDLAIIYGSVAKRLDTSSSDVDILIVSDDLTLEDTFASLSPVEEQLDRKINPSLLTTKEFESRRVRRDSFLQRVLRGPVIVLTGTLDDQ